MSGDPRVLVLTLYTGEAEFTNCKRSIADQDGVTIAHEVLAGRGNVEAHRWLYSQIEQRAAEFDICVKVDADMVLEGGRTLRSLADTFEMTRGLDHLAVAVHDFYTDSPMMGLHAFSPRVRWPRADDTLFVDADPVVPGSRMVLWAPDFPTAYHSPDPSPEQAFAFGVHRARKAIQRDRRRSRGSQARQQWQVLTRTWDRFVDSHDRRRGLAIAGADLVFENADTDLDYRALARKEAERLACDAADLDEALRGRWHPSLARELRHLRALGLEGSLRYVGARVRGHRP